MTAPYSRQSPSPRYLALAELYRTMHRDGDPNHEIPPEKMFDGRSLVPQAGIVKNLIDRVSAKTLLDYGCGKAEAYEKAVRKLPDGSLQKGLKAIWGLEEIFLFDPGVPEYSTLPTKSYDLVISTDVMEHLPEQDLPWILEEIFSFSEKAVFASIALYPARKTLPNGENAHITLKPIPWWNALFQATQQKHHRPYFLHYIDVNRQETWVEG